MMLFEHLSTAWSAVVLWGLLLLTARLGFVSFRWIGHGDRETADGSGPDTLLAATLGLLALLLGFTFSLALQRNEDRRDLVIAEANALTTSWERTQALSEPALTRVSVLLRNYTAARLVWSNASRPEEMDTASRRAVQLRASLWRAVIEAARNSSGVITSDTLIGPFNSAFEAAYSRVARRDDRMPPHIINLLLFYTFTSAGMIGWRLGAVGHRYRVATGLMLLLLALAISVIVDLDTPRSGDIVVSQQAMVDALSRMR